MLHDLHTAPTLDDIATMAEVAFAELPTAFQRACGRVVFRVADFADEKTLRSVGLSNRWHLSGLYHGAAIGAEYSSNPPMMPAEVWLYRQPILAEWHQRGDISLERLVSHVLVHEIGHHMGLSDDDIDAIEDAA
jgi:predicted Zn-dependent protease with MMP-like domain